MIVYLLKIFFLILWQANWSLIILRMNVQQSALICFQKFQNIIQKKLYPISLNYFISWGWATNKKNWKFFLNKKNNNKIKFNFNTPYSKFLKKEIQIIFGHLILFIII